MTWQTATTMIHSFWIRTSVGVVVFLLAVWSLFYTFKYNRDQAAYVGCGVEIMEAFGRSFKVRDQIQLRVNDSARAVAIARHVAILALFERGQGNRVDLEEAERTYNAAYDRYIKDIVELRTTIVANPVPSNACLVAR